MTVLTCSGAFGPRTRLGVIILTGNQDVVLARAGLQIGAVDCLFKPSGLDRLGSAVALSLERLRASKVGAV
ncbi:MAG: hypothetical protein DME09_15220 [Candidatus Rokuibacteriota bacterium]|nr:MAG: hypothetical protein DME09_15220 [Candidatus Rokubacteria bacterium]